ncbi:MAG: enoyl-CoA hydratase/isomerase family protein, partial [Pseudomonadales bacterium]|nr:enoyl-CoA hydratase/isomerase family protein [Pseudomonadales bacterium]
QDTGQFRHWRVYRDDSQLLWVYLDRARSEVNTLDGEVLDEFDTILDGLEEKPPRALILRSLKPRGFCAGADVGQFADLNAEQIAALIGQGHRTLDRLENLAQPTVAVIHGHCLGGGLEVALACRFRIGLAGNLEAGFPEIRLGLHPGLGGTFRLLERSGSVTAMRMMLTGSSAHERQLLTRGLVDYLVEERHLEGAVKKLLNEAVTGRSQRHLSWIQRLANSYPARQILSRRMLAAAERSAPARHYPAPAALVELWRRQGGNRGRMQTAEQESFVRLTGTAASRNLVRVFSLREGLLQAVKEENRIRQVHIIGAGAMGGDIAAWCALQGLQVSLADLKVEPIAAAIGSLGGLGRRRHKSAIEIRNARDRLIPDPRGHGVEQADLVIEAVPENLQIKTSIHQAVEPRLKDGAILATNTSSIPLEKLATLLQRPERLVGIHFFNPVASMQVVEIVSHQGTSESARQQAMAFSKAIGKLPVAVKSYPGFLVNRALTPYLLEAALLLDEGLDRELIDRVAVEFGMPMGPLELADQVGLDICLDVADMLRNLLDSPMAEVPAWMREKVKKGELGRKTGQGIYTWQKGKAQKQGKGPEPDAGTRQACQDRLILPMLNACAECYRERVVSGPEHLDAALIFATGFAPFRGGPIHYAQSLGLETVRQRH